jgi:hypothetical protein
MHAPTHATKRQNGADSRKTGALDQKQFNVAMALVALAQSAYALIAAALRQTLYRVASRRWSHRR